MLRVGAVAVLKLLLTSVVLCYNNFLGGWRRVSFQMLFNFRLETVIIPFLGVEEYVFVLSCYVEQCFHKVF
jgi:hypothetical protein